jgi:hypothetical protein
MSESGRPVAPSSLEPEFVVRDELGKHPDSLRIFRLEKVKS